MPQASFNNLGAIAALNRRPTKKSFAQRTVSPLSAGGLRQSTITLVQTSLGGGVLTLAFAMRLSGLGLGLGLLGVLGLVAFMGMDVMMRGAVKLEAFDTASLLAKCVGKWSGPAMDLLLVLYGNGALIAYFILLSDFLPAIAADIAEMGWISHPEMDPQAFRTRCILSTLIVVIPLSIPRKLSALRYATPIALLAITFTAITVLMKCSGLFSMHDGMPGWGDIEWVKVDWGFFQTFSILLFAYNCHLNVVPVASEMTDPCDRRISKVTSRVVVVEFVFYALIAAGGYLSFLAKTDQNILNNYGTSAAVTLCRTLLSFTILVGIPTNLLPTARSMQGFVEALIPGVASASPPASPLLGCESGGGQIVQAGPTARSEVLRLALTALCLIVEVSVAIVVPNVADVMGFLGASVGTVLMMVLPAAVLLKARPDGFSPARVWFTATCLIGATMVSCMAIVVMVLQKNGVLPA